MPMRRLGTVAVPLVVLLWSVSLAVAHAAGAADSAPLTGQWVLNRHDSDDIPGKLKAAMHRGGHGFFSGGDADSAGDNSRDPGDRDGVGLHHAGGSGEDSGPDAESGAAGASHSLIGLPLLQHELFEADRLRIEAAGNAFTLTYPDGKVRRILHDAPGHTTSASGQYPEGSFGYSTAYWDDATLVFETHADAGQRTLEKYTSLKNGAQLQLEIVLEIPHQSKPLVLRRIFDRAP